jgi:hypothetical protein
VRYW